MEIRQIYRLVRCGLVIRKEKIEDEYSKGQSRSKYFYTQLWKGNNFLKSTLTTFPESQRKFSFAILELTQITDIETKKEVKMEFKVGCQ